MDKTNNTKIWKEYEKTVSFILCCGNINWHSHFGEQTNNF